MSHKGDRRLESFLSDEEEPGADPQTQSDDAVVRDPYADEGAAKSVGRQQPKQSMLDSFGVERAGPFTIHDRFIVHPMVRPGTIRARSYQLAMAQQSLRASTLIVLPTGLGKTVIAALVAAEFLHRDPHDKIVFVAPTKPLADQHAQRFATFLQPVPSALFSGAVTPAQRAEQWPDARVVFSTPQTIRNDLENERYTFEDVALLIVDEAHRAVGKYAYVALGEHYEGTVLALTASPGASRKRIEEVRENLHIDAVAARTRADPDVAPYCEEILVDWDYVELTPALQRIRVPLQQFLHTSVKKLQKLGLLRYKRADQVSKKDILSARGTILKRFNKNKGTMFGAIHNQTLAVYAYHAIELLETQGVIQCRDYLTRMATKDEPTKAEKSFINAPEIARTLELTGRYDDLSHPKLLRVSDIVRETVADGGTAIIFTQIRETIPQIIDILDGLGVRRFVGQSTAADGKGLTQAEQREVLEAFTAREFDVLVATSVAEEGIDIPDVTLVVFYEPIPSEIRAIQRRGRTGRSSLGRVVVLVTVGTRDEAYLRAEAVREKQMRKMVRWMTRQG